MIESLASNNNESGQITSTERFIHLLSTHPFNISLNALTSPLINSSTSGNISQPVYEYKSDSKYETSVSNGINTTPSPSRLGFSSPAGEMNKSGVKDAAAPTRLAPPSLEDAKKEYDRKHRRIDTISSRLGEKMLAGWTLLGATCPEPECCSSPLMSIPGGVIICVGCDQIFEHSPYDGRYAPVRKVVSPSKFSSHPNDRTPVSLGGAVLGAVSLSPIVSKQTDLLPTSSSSSSSSLRYANNNSNNNNDISASPTTRYSSSNPVSLIHFVSLPSHLPLPTLHPAFSQPHLDDRSDLNFMI